METAGTVGTVGTMGTMGTMGGRVGGGRQTVTGGYQVSITTFVIEGKTEREKRGRGRWREGKGVREVREGTEDTCYTPSHTSWHGSLTHRLNTLLLNTLLHTFTKGFYLRPALTHFNRGDVR